MGRNRPYPSGIRFFILNTASELMKLIVNGKELEIQESQTITITELLKKLGINPERVAVEVNLAIIKKVDYSAHILNEGDQVEIVNFVGGG